MNLKEKLYPYVEKVISFFKKYILSFFHKPISKSISKQPNSDSVKEDISIIGCKVKKVTVKKHKI